MRLPICQTADCATRINARNMSRSPRLCTTQRAKATRCAHPVAVSKVRIYRRHGEQVRELQGTQRKYARGDRNRRYVCTAKIENANARMPRNYGVVYGNSRQYPVESRRIRKTISVNRAASVFNSRFRVLLRLPKNKTVRRPHGRSHRQSAHER